MVTKPNVVGLVMTSFLLGQRKAFQMQSEVNPLKVDMPLELTGCVHRTVMCDDWRSGPRASRHSWSALRNDN